jgi:O-methyltransferase
MQIKNGVYKIISKSRLILSKIRLLKIFYHIYLSIIGRGKFVFVVEEYFTGWGMTTGTRTPWMDGGGHKITQDFCIADNQLKKLVKEKYFNMSQFSEVDPINILNQLAWRHYIVYWSSIYAINNTRTTKVNLVECGVCDGMSAFYALSAAKTFNKPVKAFLYDAWEGMKEDYLVDSEKSTIGDYSYLNIESTKNNLSSFGADVIIFNKGYVPDVFQVAQNPDSLVWLHIDLNSALPTVGALNYFWDKMEAGGVILFDDYAWPGWKDTQKSVEEWSTDKRGLLFHLPTGQALFIKNTIV